MAGSVVSPCRGRVDWNMPMIPPTVTHQVSPCRGRVDWNIFTKMNPGKRSSVSPSRGRVDWNTSSSIILFPSLSSLLAEGEWIEITQIMKVIRKRASLSPQRESGLKYLPINNIRPATEVSPCRGRVNWNIIYTYFFFTVRRLTL